jgi:hypothetical protein
MGPSSNHKKQFSAQDIERYHGGLLSADEMHALEKAALDDPFLADALEGYSYTTTPKQDLEQLKKRLQEKSGNKRSLLYIFNTPAFKIAAMILILAGSGWIIYNGLKNGEHTIAQERSVVTTKTDTSSTLSKDTAQTIARESDLKTETEQESKTVNISKQKSVQQKQEPSGYNKAQRDELAKKEIAVPVTPPSDQNETTVLKKNIPVDKDKAAYRMTNDSSSLAAGSKNDLEAKSDMFKNRSLAASTSKPATFNSGDTIKNMNITLKPLPDSQPAEVVVVGYGVPKKKGPRPITIVDTLEPAEGWNSYNDYVLSNLKSPEELHMKPISGQVELSFDVNNEGEPVNITVVKSLCYKCDDEAIRILKEGPKWKKKKKGKGKIAIKF